MDRKSRTPASTPPTCSQERVVQSLLRIGNLFDLANWGKIQIFTPVRIPRCYPNCFLVNEEPSFRYANGDDGTCLTREFLKFEAISRRRNSGG